MWIDLLLLLMILLPLAFWNGVLVRRSQEPAPAPRESSPMPQVAGLQAEPAIRPHRSPAL